jgi:hypothetical protein
LYTGKMGGPECLSRPRASASTNVHGRPFWQISFPRRSPERNDESASTTSTEARSGLRFFARRAIRAVVKWFRDAGNSRAPLAWGPDPSSRAG